MEIAQKNARERTVVIVGAGPGGLAASILLAAAAVRVRIIERLPIVGGRTSTIESEGFQFDLGPTFFLYPRVLTEVMQAAGTTLEREVNLVRLDPQYRLLFGAGGRLDCTSDAAEMERQIAAIAPADAGGFAQFLRENRSKLALMQPYLESPFHSWRDLLNPRLLKLLPTLQPHLSIDAYLRRFFSDERTRLAFSFQSKYLGMSPFRCPSLFSILWFLEYEYGVFHPIGGCGAITAALARVARRLGVEIKLDEPVRELLLEKKRAVGVRTDRGSYRADAVVVTRISRALCRVSCLMPVVAAGRKRSSRARNFPARPSCSISGSKAATICLITTSTSRAITSGTSTRSKISTCSHAATLRFMCRTRPSLTRRLHLPA